MYAEHAIAYQSLPDTLIVFDLYETISGIYLSRGALSRKLDGTGIHQVPTVSLPGEVDDERLHELVRTLPSAYYDGLAEGVYLRREKDGKLVDQAKLFGRISRQVTRSGQEAARRI